MLHVLILGTAGKEVVLVAVECSKWLFLAPFGTFGMKVSAYLVNCDGVELLSLEIN